MNTLFTPELTTSHRTAQDERALRQIGKLVAGFPIDITNRDGISSATFASATPQRLFTAEVTDYGHYASRSVRIHAERLRSNWGPEALSDIEVDVTWDETHGSDLPPVFVSASRAVAHSMQEDRETTYDSTRPEAENTFSALDVARVLSLVPTHSPVTPEVEALAA